jgi:CDGSH-type Zn-finger protein
MSEAKIAQKSPYAVDVVAGRRYAWCACGHSKKQPFCDGSHAGTGFLPMIFEAEETTTVYFCGCKQTKTPVLCDGTHNDL